MVVIIPLMMFWVAYELFKSGLKKENDTQQQK